MVVISATCTLAFEALIEGTSANSSIGDVGLLPAERRGGRGGIDDVLQADLVQVRQPLPEVVGVLDEDRLLVAPVLLHDEGAGADGVALEVAVLLHDLARHDHRPRARDVVQERRVRLLGLEDDRVLVRRLDAGQLAEEEVGVLELPRLVRHLPLDAVLDVLRRELAPVHRRHVVELDALPQAERVREVVLLLPALGQVRQDLRAVVVELQEGVVRLVHHLEGGAPGLDVRVDAADGSAPHHQGAAALGVALVLGPRDPGPDRGQARHPHGTSLEKAASRHVSDSTRPLLAGFMRTLLFSGDQVTSTSCGAGWEDGLSGDESQGPPARQRPGPAASPSAA